MKPRKSLCRFIGLVGGMPGDMAIERSEKGSKGRNYQIAYVLAYRIASIRRSEIRWLGGLYSISVSESQNAEGE